MNTGDRLTPSPRRFRRNVNAVLLLTAALATHSTPNAFAADKVTVVDSPPVSTTNRFYLANRPPLTPSPFVKLPIGSITPRGWLRDQLELERDGMIGHLKEISPWLNFQTSAWANKEGKG